MALFKHLALDQGEEFFSMLEQHRDINYTKTVLHNIRKYKDLVDTYQKLTEADKRLVAKQGRYKKRNPLQYLC